MHKTSRTPIVCFSHLAWDPGLFQRPQQIMSRLAALGHDVYYFACVGRQLHKSKPHRGPVEGSPGVNVYTVPYAPGVRKLAGIRKWAAAMQIAGVLRKEKVRRPVLWFYHPSLFALGYSHSDAAVVYDVMDHFPSFESTVDDVYFDELMMLAEADVVFTGGRTLHRHTQQMLDTLRSDESNGIDKGVAQPGLTAQPACFPSGIDLQHFGQALHINAAATSVTSDEEQARLCPVFGYFGAIDERMDWDLIRHLASATDGYVVLAGPILQSVPSDLPANVQLPGPVPYQKLPALLATFDVALIPFRDSPLVRHVSPTKTPEYLAGGKPVVSTPIPDVFADYGDVVVIADKPEAFTAACLKLAQSPPAPESLAAEAGRRARNWDQIARAMDELVTAAVDKNRAAEGW